MTASTAPEGRPRGPRERLLSRPTPRHGVAVELGAALACDVAVAGAGVAVTTITTGVGETGNGVTVTTSGVKVAAGGVVVMMVGVGETTWKGKDSKTRTANDDVPFDPHLSAR